MATEIKPTRPLYGKEAKDFCSRMEKWSKETVSQEAFNRAKRTYEKMKKKHPDMP